MPYKEGQRLIVIVPINVSEDCEWEVGTQVEIVQVRERDIDTWDYEIASADGNVGSFADIDIDGEYRWFDLID